MGVLRFRPKSEGPLCEAIRQRRRLALDYGEGERTVEPYIHGLDRHGQAVLRAYQLAGPSKLGHTNRWRLFQLSRATDLRILDQTFSGEREDFNSQDPDIAHVHCQIGG